MHFGPQETIWIAGAEGRLGCAIAHHLDHERYKIITSDREVDVADLPAVTRFAESHRPDVIINCAGFTDRAGAEGNQTEAYRVNALGARNLAIASASTGGAIIHLSIDDLFEGGHAEPVNEFDPIAPVSAFGKSKAAGESLVRSLNHRHIIIRSSWVYTALPEDVIRRSIAAAREGVELRLPANQLASPTSSYTLVKFLIAVMESGEYGTFHAASAGICSRFAFVERILEFAGLPRTGLVRTYDARDAYRIELDNLMIRLVGMPEMPAWEDDLRAYMTRHGLIAKEGR